ncbi:unnamed protein product [Callosobruchus maculatus]|uniref:THAP9-like helix-turn-helix domain-containing protein n=1 Tax=Callosobruchus maculatus TaxID=64391 RepID=A0A653BPU2_CALMS|nr:unnamed protein product [Callosobruchus maculatus]
MYGRRTGHTHLNAFLDAVDKLNEMGIEINADLLAIMLLYSLPASFESFRCAIESRDELPTPEILRIKIIEEYNAPKSDVRDGREIEGAMLVKKKFQYRGSYDTHKLTRENKEEINALQNKIRRLEEENNELRRKVKEAEISTEQRYEAILSKVFTKGQIKKLKCSAKDKRIRWSPEDISSAISLRSVSPKAYRYLKANNYPLPALSTLRKWVSDWLQTISRGSLLYPNEQLWEVVKTMDEEFYKMHGMSLSKNKNIFHELAQQTLSKLTNNSFAFEVILCLSRTQQDPDVSSQEVEQESEKPSTTRGRPRIVGTGARGRPKKIRKVRNNQESSTSLAEEVLLSEFPIRETTRGQDADE